jgi:hypothetical protein
VIRWIIAILVSLLGGIIITAPLTPEECASSYLGWVIDLGSAARCDYWRGVLVNLATEAIGIAIVVAIVDFILERVRTGQEAGRAARGQANYILQEMHKAVYVWVGGRSRSYNPHKLADRLHRIKPDVHRLRGGAGGEAKGANEAVLRLCADAQYLLSEVTDSRIKAALEKLRAGGTDESAETARYYLDALRDAWA